MPNNKMGPKPTLRFKPEQENRREKKTQPMPYTSEQESKPRRQSGITTPNGMKNVKPIYRNQDF